jgi:hypothetical protein
MDNFANHELREEIKRHCLINCIISLPLKTFFNTNKKTYILGIQKKTQMDSVQDTPIFNYLVSNIGEQLNTDRFEIENSDLEQAKNLFNQFKGSKNSFKVDDPRCKLVDFNTFNNSKYWIIENYWSEKELISLDIKDEKKSFSIKQYGSFLDELVNEIEASKKKIKEIEKEISKVNFAEKKITDLMDIQLGKAEYTKEYINNNKGNYPVYSAQTLDDGEIGRISTYDWDTECLTWSIDGSYPGFVFYRKGKFNMTCHCGMLTIKKEYKNLLSYKYLHHVLYNHLPNYSQGQGNKRLKKTHIEQDVEKIKIPINSNCSFDLKRQNEIANKYEIIQNIKKKLKDDYQKILQFGIQIG